MEHRSLIRARLVLAGRPASFAGLGLAGFMDLAYAVAGDAYGFGAVDLWLAPPEAPAPEPVEPTATTYADASTWGRSPQALAGHRAMMAASPPAEPRR